jgi:hypothetical protein
MTYDGDNEPLWTVRKVAHLLDVKEETIRSWTRSGFLVGTKIGKSWRYSPEIIRNLQGQIKKGVPLFRSSQDPSEY